jgi:hypothetical protein
MSSNMIHIKVIIGPCRMLSPFIQRALQSTALGGAGCETSTVWIVDVLLMPQVEATIVCIYKNEPKKFCRLLTRRAQV